MMICGCGPVAEHSSGSFVLQVEPLDGNRAKVVRLLLIPQGSPGWKRVENQRNEFKQL